MPMICFDERNFSLRFLTMLYSYILLLDRENNIENVLEIGGGTGYLSHIFNRTNLVVKYHIIDLPLVSLIQGYIFSILFGENNVWFHGEPENNNAKLFLYSPNNIEELNQITFDVVFNQNSLVEIPIDQSQKYVKLIEETLNNGSFISINQSIVPGGQFSLDEIMKPSTLKLIENIPYFGEPPADLVPGIPVKYQFRHYKR